MKSVSNLSLVCFRVIRSNCRHEFHSTATGLRRSAVVVPGLSDAATNAAQRLGQVKFARRMIAG